MVVVPVLDEPDVECRDVVVDGGFAVCRETGVVLGRAIDYDGWISSDDVGRVYSNYGGRLTSKSFMWNPMQVLMQKIKEAAEKLFGSADVVPDEWRRFTDLVVEYCKSRRKVGGSFGQAVRSLTPKAIATAWFVYRGLRQSEFSRLIKEVFGDWVDHRTVDNWRKFFAGEVTSVWHEYNMRTWRRSRARDWL